MSHPEPERNHDQVTDLDVQATVPHPSAAPASDEKTVDHASATGQDVGGGPAPGPLLEGQRYRIVKPHARGGLGEVFLAHDEELNREVALKQIQRSQADSRQNRARFVLEAEITGGLEHPGIVPVYSLGADADGRPFYVMRFIRGDSLKEAILKHHQARLSGSKDAPLEFRKLLARFIDVCNTMQYAHDRGVLHRDLKPANIMLGKYGETLVVDWGLAKASGEAPSSTSPAEEPSLQPLAMDSGSETMPGTPLGTPQFMSPEQAEGRLDQLSPASDVYSLGATLYFLLTGKAPFDGSSGTVAKVQRGDFPRPRQADPSLCPALEAVCLKAMALKPEDRYAGPRLLAGDVERWLADAPVSAWPEPLLVKTRRWVGRHRTLVASAAAALLMAVLAATAAGIWYQNQRVQRDTEVALRQQAIRTALDQAQTNHDKLRKLLREPGSVFDLLNEPARWQALVQACRASYAQARALLDLDSDLIADNVKSEVAALEALVAQDEIDQQLAVRLDRIRLARMAWVDGRFDDTSAARNYPKTFAAANYPVLDGEIETVAARIGASAIKEQLVAALDDWAGVALRTPDLSLLERLLHVIRLASPDSAWGDRVRQVRVFKDRTLLTEVAPPKNMSRQLFTLVGNLLPYDSPEKESWTRNAQARYPNDFWLNLDLGNAISFNDTRGLEAEGFYRAALAVRPDSMAALNNLGEALRTQKRFDEAMSAYRRAIQLDTDGKFAPAHSNLAAVLLDVKDVEGAIRHGKMAVAIDPGFAAAHFNLGVALQTRRDLAGAAREFRKCIALDPKNDRAFYNLGVVLRDQNDLAGSVLALTKATELNARFTKAYFNLGNVLLARKDWRAAVDTYNKAIESDPKNSAAYNNLGTALRKLNDMDGAFRAFRKAVDLDDTNATAHNNLGSALRDSGDLPAAVAAFEKSAQLNPKFALAFYNLADAQRDQKHLDQAIDAYRTAIELEPKYPKACINLGLALKEQQRLGEAAAAFRQAIDIDPKFAAAYGNLAVTLVDQQRFSEAVAVSRQAVQLNPRNALANYNLGRVYFAQKRLDDAVVAFEQAVDIDPKFAEAHCNLGQTLREQGHFKEALKELKLGHQLGSKRSDWTHPSAEWISQCQQLLDLENRLPAVFEGRVKAAPDLLLQLASIQRQAKKVSAVRLYEEAFRVQPKFADTLERQDRCKAAATAVLAGLGQGEDAPKIGAAEKSKLRIRGRDWLRQDLSLCAKSWQEGSPDSILQTVRNLKRWQQDPQLAGVRDAKKLAELPPGEQQDWHKLWTDVARTLKDAEGRFSETRQEGTLTAKEKSKAYERKMLAGKTYVVDMESTDFDSFLKLWDAQGRLVDENDDARPGTLNSRLIFTPAADGTYRIVATSHRERGQGAYVLVVREFAAKK